MTCASGTRAMNMSRQFEMVQGERFLVSSPMLPTMGGVGSCPTCFGMAMKRRVDDGSKKRKPAEVSRSKQIRSQVTSEVSFFQAEAMIDGAVSSNDLRELKVDMVLRRKKLLKGERKL
jgi:hypothetical protein